MLRVKSGSNSEAIQGISCIVGDLAPNAILREYVNDVTALGAFSRNTVTFASAIAPTRQQGWTRWSQQVNTRCTWTRQSVLGREAYGAMGEECTAVLTDPVWTDYRVIHYHRRGYGNSTRPEALVTIAQHCSDCLALLRHIRVERAHFVGESGGAAIVLKMIKHAPDVVHTAALLEPPLPLVVADFPEFTSVIGRALNVYQSGGKRGAMNVFAGAIVGSDVPAEVESEFREKYFDAWLRDADTACQREPPALSKWNFTAANARSVKQPVLNVRGRAHDPILSGGPFEASGMAAGGGERRYARREPSLGSNGSEGPGSTLGKLLPKASTNSAMNRSDAVFGSSRYAGSSIRPQRRT